MSNPEGTGTGGDPPTGDLHEEGEIYIRSLLDDEDDSALSIVHQEISQDLRTHTPEQLFRRIQHDNGDIPDSDSSAIPEPGEPGDDGEQGEEGGPLDVYNDDDEEAEPGVLHIICEAKSMVSLSNYRKKKRKHGTDDSNVWKLFKLVSVKEGLGPSLEGKDRSAYRKLVTAEKKGEQYCVCLTCFDTAEKPLTDCMIKPTAPMILLVPVLKRSLASISS